ncbi:putative chaperone protein HSP31 [Mariannaea sp. PMI_226]|nr:putative chaperone protein HSP31 [Mariannaea sp. PMI_226]
MATAKPKILFVLSSHSAGWYLPEFAHPYGVLSPHTKVYIASPKGTSVVDPISVNLFKEDAYCQEFFNTKKDLWTTTERISSYLGRAKEFDVVFVVGGFGPMYDLATDTESIQLIREFHDANRIVVALCHGSGALVNVKLADGSPLLAGHRVTGFSNTEEEQATNNKIVPPGMPFSLEDELNKASNGLYEKATEAWSPHVIVEPSKKLLFGQNPASAQPLAEKLLEVLNG